MGSNDTNNNDSDNHDAWLIIRYQSEPVGKFHLIGRTSWIIGRSRDCDIKINDPCISRHQATLEVRPRHHLVLFWIMDHQSRNGTLVNGSLTREKLLHDGDIIMMGNTDLLFRYAGVTRTLTDRYATHHL